MFQLTCYGWLLFRATSFEQIAAMTSALFRPWHVQAAELVPLWVFAAPLVAIELGVVFRSRLPAVLPLRLPLELRVAAYSALAYLAIFAAAPPQSFIYFRF